MKKILTLTMVALTSLVLQANAHLITPAGNLFLAGPDSEANMSTLLGTSVDLLFKAEYDDGVLGGTEGSFGSYFTITLIDESHATLSWNLTGSGVELLGVAWKDGNLAGQPGTAGAFLWSAVSADQRIIGGPDNVASVPVFNGAISHISFYGRETTSRVPEGGSTAILLGLAMLGFGGVRRKLKK
jgi:hypothetical protein